MSYHELDRFQITAIRASIIHSLYMNVRMFYYECKLGDVGRLQWMGRYNVSKYILLFDVYRFVVWSVTR
jgi:hypothetical protein